jgi:hypothetical protein
VHAGRLQQGDRVVDLGTQGRRVFVEHDGPHVTAGCLGDLCQPVDLATRSHLVGLEEP